MKFQWTLQPTKHVGTAQVTEIQEGHGVQLVELTDTTGEISQRVNKVNQAGAEGHVGQP